MLTSPEIKLLFLLAIPIYGIFCEYHDPIFWDPDPDFVWIRFQKKKFIQIWCSDGSRSGEIASYSAKKSRRGLSTYRAQNKTGVMDTTRTRVSN